MPGGSPDRARSPTADRPFAPRTSRAILTGVLAAVARIGIRVPGEVPKTLPGGSRGVPRSVESGSQEMQFYDIFRDLLGTRNVSVASETEEKARISGLFLVAGAGFEPATFGL